ncbi:hypothetical protein Hanom_Chr11g00971321 [Helianthus anomalus]
MLLLFWINQVFHCFTSTSCLFKPSIEVLRETLCFFEPKELGTNILRRKLGV